MVSQCLDACRLAQTHSGTDVGIQARRCDGWTLRSSISIWRIRVLATCGGQTWRAPSLVLAQPSSNTKIEIENAINNHEGGQLDILQARKFGLARLNSFSCDQLVLADAICSTLLADGTWPLCIKLSWQLRYQPTTSPKTLSWTGNIVVVDFICKHLTNSNEILTEADTCMQGGMLYRPTVEFLWTDGDKMEEATALVGPCTRGWIGQEPVFLC